MLAISEVSRQTGLAPSTLRYYEEKGLIESAGRRGLTRLFEPRVLEQLALILLGRCAGFSLDDIGEMVSRNGSANIDRRRLQDKADELDASIQKMISVRDGLAHAAKCPAENHMDCPTFQRLLKEALHPAKDSDINPKAFGRK